MIKKLSRTSVFNENAQTYTTAAYLIAQLGKNYSLPKEQQISGSNLLTFATEKILNIHYLIGGILIFLECRNNPFLIDFYQKHNFKLFSTRTSNSNQSAYQLNQFLQFI